MAKSGVSRHVSQLEEHFGVRLLERGARSVRLTPIGEKLDGRIRSILAELDFLDSLVDEENTGASGQVTIAATPEFGGLVATELFPQLLETHPNLTVVMRPDYAFEDMQDLGTDLAFRVGTFDDDRLVARHLGGFQRWMVAAPNLLERHPLHEPEDLAALPCLTFRGDRPGATWRFVSKERETAVDVMGRIAVRSFGVLQQLAVAGQGFAFLPSFMLDEDLASGKLARCVPSFASPPAQVYLTFRPGARRIARVAAVIEAAEELVPKLLEA